MLLKVSSAWANKIIDCTLDGILNECHGKCCKGTTFYPSKSHIVDGLVMGYCYWLGDKGCKLADIDKPVKCLLYPFIINENNTIVLHGRAITSICRGCYNRGTKTILEVQRHNLELIFSKMTVGAMIESILLRHKDYVFSTYVDFDWALQFEQEREAKNLPPVPRSSYWGIKP